MYKYMRILMMCLAYILFSSVAIVGCGTKGPLYIPEQRYPQGAENNSAPKDAKQHAMQANIHKPSRASL